MVTLAGQNALITQGSRGRAVDGLCFVRAFRVRCRCKLEREESIAGLKARHNFSLTLAWTAFPMNGPGMIRSATGDDVMPQTVAVDTRLLRARHDWFVSYSDVLVQRIGHPIQQFRDRLQVTIPDTTGLPMERFHQNLVACYLCYVLLVHPELFSRAVGGLEDAGWVEQDHVRLENAFEASLSEREHIKTKELLRIFTDLLVWRLAVRFAAGISGERLYSELTNVWFDDNPQVLIAEAVATAARPSPPTFPSDDEQRMIEVLAGDPVAKKIIEDELAQYDEDTWNHPDMPHVVPGIVRAKVITALGDAGIPGFDDAKVLARCRENLRQIAEWSKQCGALEHH